MPNEGQSTHPFPGFSEGRLWQHRLKTMSLTHAGESWEEYIGSSRFGRFQESNKILNNSLLRTLGGDLGFGPPTYQPGGEVWVLENGRVPFLLRPTEDECSFRLIRECYVHGIMDGQLFAEGPPEYQRICPV
jgi:hypothetical protein